MYLDAELLFSHNQKITETAVSDKMLDLGGTGSAENGGMPVFPLVQVTEGFEGLTSLTVHIQSCRKAAQPEEGEWQTIMSSAVLPLAEIAKPCSVGFGSLPPKAGNWLRVRYEVEGTAAKGAVTAALVTDRQSQAG